MSLTSSFKRRTWVLVSSLVILPPDVPQWISTPSTATSYPQIPCFSTDTGILGSCYFTAGARRSQLTLQVIDLANWRISRKRPRTDPAGAWAPLVSGVYSDPKVPAGRPWVFDIAVCPVGQQAILDAHHEACHLLQLNCEGRQVAAISVLSRIHSKQASRYKPHAHQIRSCLESGVVIARTPLLILLSTVALVFKGTQAQLGRRYSSLIGSAYNVSSPG